MRLTITKKKEPELFSGLENVDENKYFIKAQIDEPTTWQCVADKLGQLEDIEESTNIPFAKISSLKTGNIVYFKIGRISEGMVSNINYEDLTITVLTKEGTFTAFMLFHQYGKNRYAPLHCWSGAWALTKEELE